MPKICPLCDRTYEDEHIFCAADGTALRSVDRPDDLIGSVVDDRYLVQSLLGEGGMGRVYLAQHVHLPRRVALKVLHEQLHHDPAAMARFNREASNASRIEHPRVARVFDFGRMPGGSTYLAMEYIEGRTLAAILAEQGALPIDRVVVLVQQIADGLMAAHALDIVHRDLKPDNVMIMPGVDGLEQVKIVDFGIAKTVGDLDAGTLTAPGFVTGTPEYMSAEQLLGSQLDARADVYALGVLTFKALTDRLPFPSPTPERGFGSALTDVPKTLSEVRPERRWPPGLQPVFDRVLSRQRESRYPTARAFADALRAAAAGDDAAPLARRADPAIALRPPEPIPTEDAPALQEQMAAGRRSMPIAVAAVALVVVLGGVFWWWRQSDSNTAPPELAIGQPVPVADSAPPRATESTADSAPAAGGSSSSGSPAGGAPIGGTAATGATNAGAPGKAAGAPTGGGAAGTKSAGTKNPGSTGAGAPRPEAPAATNLTAQLDAIRDSLDALLMTEETRESPAHALGVMARVDALLPSLPQRDSARALLLKANLLKLAGQREKACAVVELARPVAVTAVDRRAVGRVVEGWSCGR
jgi:serine/threonine-protein kinase